MVADEIIRQILLKCPEISKEQILERLERERRKTGGFIPDETLLQVIGAEFGCQISSSETAMPRLSLRDLVPGLNDVTVVGRVIAVFPIKAFSGNRNGKFASLLLADKHGILRVVLWNSKASLMESGELKVGQLISFSHAYTREDYSGKIELHIGEKCEVEVNPKGLEAKDYPTVANFTTDIGELKHAHNNRRVNVVGRVKKLFSATAFERQDSSSGKVMRLIIFDRTGEIPVVIWNEKVDELEKMLEVGADVQIVNARVKKAMEEGLEIHVDGAVYVETLTSANRFLKIADLKDDMKCVNVMGEVVSKPIVREVKTSRQEMLKLANFELRDETGRIWVSAWREHAESVQGLKVGDRLIINGAWTKRGFGDHVELSTRSATLIVKNPD